MAISLPNGSIVEIASGYAAAINVTVLSNAAEALATATNTYGAGDYVEVTSGWSRLTNKILRVKSPTGTNFVLEGFDTISTGVFSAGSGVGTSRKITGWTQLQQILDTDSSGGEQQFTEYQLLEADAQKRIPTTKAASGLRLVVADDPALAGYQVASVANDDRVPRAVRISLANGSKLLYNAYVSLNKTPTLKVNEIMSCELTLSLLAEPVRYAT